ncbi:S1 RNA-binding domain-containing protein [Nocardia sp. NPDC050713]|uniref:S1 RNA-binding domain-containing protein n=1 Tax=Nocardia sp. NPDC050713 TaxID=3154511 RepID=UPI0033F10070
MSHTDFDVDAWQRFAAAHGVQSVLDATVVQIVPFGAFLEVAPGVHGLLHRNEWSHWSAEPQVGAAMAVRILAIDAERYRVSLAAA